MRVALIHPPDAIIPIVPCSSIPVLTAVLHAAGHTVKAYDAGQIVARETLQTDKVEHWYDLMEAAAADLEAVGSRDAEQNAELRRLQRLLAMPRSMIAELDDAIAMMRDMDRFSNPAIFNRKFDVLRACFQLVYSLNPDGYFNMRRVGHDVLGSPTPGLPDPPMEVFERLVDRILADRPDIVGLTVPFDSAIFFALKIAQMVKARAPHVVVIMGGSAIESNSYPVMTDPFYFTVLDYVMIGEGEVQFPRFVDAIASGSDPREVNNLRWLAEDGTIGKTEMLLVTDLNAVPAPDFSALDYDNYMLPNSLGTLQTSRGCYYGKCTFCSELFRKGFRIRRPDLVVDDMVAIYEQTGIRHFHVWDSLAPPKTLKKIALEVKARNLPFVWMAETKFERPYREEETIRILAEGGCRFLQFGFESGSSRVLDLIDKGNDLDDVDQTLAHMKKYGIRAGVTWFIGFPGETEHEADVSYDFIASRRDRLMFSGYARAFSLGTDTILYEQQERFGIEAFMKSEGVLDFRYRDGTEHWDTEERNHAFWVRGDFYLIMNSIHLHYSTLSQEAIMAVTGQERCGPLIRHINPDVLERTPFVRTPEVSVRHFRVNPQSAAGEGYAIAFHSLTGFSFDLDADGVRLLEVLDTPRTYAQIVTATGFAPERIHRLVDLAVNRGMVRAIVEVHDIHYLPEADLAAKVLASS